MTFEDIKPGDTVVISVPGGRRPNGTYEYVQRKGRVVMRGPAGWVLNLGGPHGTPGIATRGNFVNGRRGRRRRNDTDKEGS